MHLHKNNFVYVTGFAKRYLFHAQNLTQFLNFKTSLLCNDCIIMVCNFPCKIFGYMFTQNITNSSHRLLHFFADISNVWKRYVPFRKSGHTQYFENSTLFFLTWILLKQLASSSWNLCERNLSKNCLSCKIFHTKPWTNKLLTNLLRLLIIGQLVKYRVPIFQFHS